MLIVLNVPVMLGSQSLAAGVMADVPDDAAQRLIDAGTARPAGTTPQTSNPALDGMLDVPSAPPRRRKAEG